jgi:hypothetical protein
MPLAYNGLAPTKKTEDLILPKRAADDFHLFA